MACCYYCSGCNDTRLGDAPPNKKRVSTQHKETTEKNPARKVVLQRGSRQEQLEELEEFGVLKWTWDEILEDPVKISKRSRYDFLLVDEDESGELTLDEVMKACRNAMPPEIPWDKKQQKDVVDIFVRMDRDGNGTLDAAEFAVLTLSLRLSHQDRAYKEARRKADRHARDEFSD